MIFVGDLQDFANWRFHSGHHFHFHVERECFGRRIVRAFGELDAGAHVVDPRTHELLLQVIVAFGAHPFKLHVFHFAGFIRHLHFARDIHNNVAAAHDGFARGGAFRLLRRRIGVWVHPEFDGVSPVAVHAGEKFVVLVELRHLHHLFHHLLRIRLTGWSAHGCRRRGTDTW